MTTTLPQRRIGPLEVGAIGLGCMGMTWAYSTGARDDARSAAGSSSA
jgi:aryl-alcohol dehydrogenase-like predicted oxidoreductase